MINIYRYKVTYQTLYFINTVDLNVLGHNDSFAKMRISAYFDENFKNVKVIDKILISVDQAIM